MWLKYCLLTCLFLAECCFAESLLSTYKFSIADIRYKESDPDNPSIFKEKHGVGFVIHYDKAQRATYLLSSRHTFKQFIDLGFASDRRNSAKQNRAKLRVSFGGKGSKSYPAYIPTYSLDGDDADMIVLKVPKSDERAILPLCLRGPPPEGERLQMLTLDREGLTPLSLPGVFGSVSSRDHRWDLSIADAKKGMSGSPIFRGKNVVGIYSAGVPNKAKRSAVPIRFIRNLTKNLRFNIPLKRCVSNEKKKASFSGSILPIYEVVQEIDSRHSFPIKHIKFACNGPRQGTETHCVEPDKIIFGEVYVDSDGKNFKIESQQVIGGNKCVQVAWASSGENMIAECKYRGYIHYIVNTFTKQFVKVEEEGRRYNFDKTSNQGKGIFAAKYPYPLRDKLKGWRYKVSSKDANSNVVETLDSQNENGQDFGTLITKQGVLWILPKEGKPELPKATHH